MLRVREHFSQTAPKMQSQSGQIDLTSLVNVAKATLQPIPHRLSPVPFVNQLAA